jgi:RNA polymerase sigma-70 factor (ECF subfamily)
LANLLSDDPDRDLLPAAIRGDLDAFDALVRRYQARMVSFARTLSGVPEDAEDLAQEVFVRVFRSLGSFRGDSSFRTWVYRVAINVSRTHRSRRLRERAVWQDSGADADTAFDPPGRTDLEAGLIARDAIERALRGLPDDLRTAVTLRDVHGLEYREIASATGVPIGTVESRIFRARQRLKAALAPLNLV